jgi:hypothetical protein
MSSKLHTSGNGASPSALAPNPARVRENQRRSRARRKEYLQELESKLQSCERFGVQASIDIQHAARAVSAENARLKEENRRLMGENQALMDVLVARNEEERTVGSEYTSTAVEETAEKMAGSIHNASGERSSLSEPKDRTRTDEDNLSNAHLPVDPSACVTHTLASRADSPAPRAPQMETHQIAIDDESLVDSQHPSSRLEQPPQSPIYNVNEGIVSGDDTSSCEYAAHIITSMRADVSTDDVRADLGCGNDVREWRKCKVNNGKLFVAMDRYTG